MAEREPRLLLSQSQACARLGLSPRQLVQKIERGHLRYVLCGQRRKFTPRDLDAYVDLERRAALDILPVRYREEFGPPSHFAPRLSKIRITALFGRARTGARLRGKRFDLTLAQVGSLVQRANGYCEVSGIRFTDDDVCGARPYAPSIDRIDSTLGYSIENCRLVCYAVNVALHQWGDAVLRRIARGIVEKADG